MIAVVGAGMAGLACAGALRDAGRAVTVFDKGRRPGGRIATRRADGAQFDHGAQFATARDPGFSATMQHLRAAGSVAPWPAASDERDVRWVGVPGMSAMARALANGSPIVTERQVALLYATADGWRVRHLAAADIRPGATSETGGELAGPFDAVLLALPAPQAVPLLGTHPFAARAAATSYAPSWTAMAVFDPPLPGPEVGRSKDGPVGWAARQSSIPGRPATPDAWVLQATAAWSRQNLEREATEIAPELCEAFTDVSPASVVAQRWRYAQVEQAAGEPCLWDAAARIGACGDWCLGGRVEAAWLSGRALAASVLASVLA